jgi:flavin reductase (DIM6/NTAB) family NADH-FMN oxidoreductase RutF
MEGGGSGFDARALRQVLGAFVTGVTVITTVDAEGRPHGLTANSFTSVSLDPPLILWSQSLTAPSHPVFREAERFVVNILADDQVEVSNRFARGGADKFSGCPTHPGLGGVPLIEGCAAYLECRRINSFPGGDHLVFLGQVDRIERTGRQPLVFGGGRYLVAQPHDLGLLAGAGRRQHRAPEGGRLATRALVELSDELDETLALGVWGNKGPTIVRWEEPASRSATTCAPGSCCRC